nr:MAG TPA: hypothetical protein [Caudoviricetes sp.]
MVESSHPDWWLGKYLMHKYLPNLLLKPRDKYGTMQQCK